jgi:NADPH-dependent 2,4-dienoyl-CoA reductase/sulfur reductase-like enzyme
VKTWKVHVVDGQICIDPDDAYQPAISEIGAADSGRHIVIIGAGHAGGRAAEALRSAGHAGPITILGNEGYPPYERPPLSKDLLGGAIEVDKTYIRPHAWYQGADIALRLNSPVAHIDRVAQRVRLEDGSTVPYDSMLIATGARPRRLTIPGADGARVFYLRDIRDSLALRQKLRPGARVAVIGAGFIGLEIAAIARQQGAEVIVLELAPHVLARVAAPEIGEYLVTLHRNNGVEIRTGVAVTSIEDTGSELRIHSADGATFSADIATVGVGSVPNAELASAAGLAVRDGIVVDEFGRTSDPAISAAGDVTQHFNPLLKRHLRLESWQNAQNQAIAVAGAMAGSAKPYAEIPWFWTDQYHVNLQMAGAPLKWDRLVWRGMPTDSNFTLFQLDAGIPVAAVTVNNGRDMRFAMQLIALGRAVDPAVLADKSVRLEDLCRQASEK